MMPRANERPFHHSRSATDELIAIEENTAVFFPPARQYFDW